ncbi:M48 family metalloprotease [Pleurocapsales cyanobacterium LEGE 10410]|nr:M48 family metalloprotease [Pleurocapsales cyanobacterium LEGE 10410]
MNSSKWLKKFQLLYLSFFIALLLVSLSNSASARHPESLAKSAQPPSEVVAFDILDAVEGAVQYIQISNISDEQEIAIGEQTNQQVLSQYPLYNNSPIQEYVRNLGQELINNSDSRDIPFIFQVLASDEVNAFATPGGFVYVTTGLLKTAENRAQLASVTAHEIAHINEKHGIKGLKQAVAARGIANTVGLDTSTLAPIAYQLAVDLPRSRSFEYEADSTGLEIMQQAGYPPEAFANFLAKLESGGGTPEFLRTHPTSDNRIEAISQKTEVDGVSNNKGQDSTEYRNNVLALM